METFELIFKDNGIITHIPIKNEPVGYDAFDFHLNQENDRYGRDWNFAGDGNVMLEFTKHAHFEVFNLLDDFYNRYGFEADVKLKIVSGAETFIGNLDFLDAEYNGYDTFKFNVNQETEEALVKKRSEMVVDMYSDIDLDENITMPAEFKKMVLPAKQIYRESVWENLSGDEKRGFDATNVSTFRFITNYANAITKSDIKNTLSWLPFYDEGSGSIDNYPDSVFPMLIDAQTDLNELELTFNFNGSFMEKSDRNSGMNAYCTAYLVYGSNLKSNSTTVQIFNFQYLAGSGSQVKIFPDKTITIPQLKTGQKIWFWFSCVGSGQGTFFVTQKNIKISAKAYEQTFDVVTDCVSLYEVTKKVVKDTSGLEIEFPLAKTGVLKNTYLFSGNMVRGMGNNPLVISNNPKKPFNISFDDLKKWFPELNLDYEIMVNKKVYIGKREDYYTDNEIDVIENVAFDSFMVQQNERYALNKFNYKYNKYQSQKENTEENTNDIVHGEAEYHINNKQVETTKNIDINFVRDPFMLQETINTALTESDNKATQDDDTIFIIDGTSTNILDATKRKTSVLYHRINNNGTLSLQNNGGFRWDLLGISYGSVFEIKTNENKGSYSVYDITASSIDLMPINTTPAPSAIGEYFTEFVYSISVSYVTLKPYFFTGIFGNGNEVSNIKSPETFANLRYSIGLNIQGYWRDFISTAVKTGKQPKQIKYINNNLYENNAYLPKHYENADLTLKEPILSTNVVNTQLIMSFERYLRICNILRSENRGFIRTFDPKGNVICLYPKEMTAVFKTSNLKEVTVLGELKNMPNELDITKSNGLYKVWIYNLPSLNYEIQNDYVVIYDTNMIPVYKKLHFTKVKVNGVSFVNIYDLQNALNSL